MDFDNLQHVNDSVFTEKTSTNCNRGFDVLNTAKKNQSTEIGIEPRFFLGFWPANFWDVGMGQKFFGR